MKILIVTAFPTEGAGSGALITTQAESYIKNGHEVEIITANNRTNFKKIPGVTYCLVPFTKEGDDPEIIEGQLPFNYFMFTTHTESTANFWNATNEEVELYCNKFREIIGREVKRFKPDIIHGQHNWITTNICSEFGLPVVVTVHGTDLMGFQRSLGEIDKIKAEMADDPSAERKAELNKALEKYEFYVQSAKESAHNSLSAIVISEHQKELFQGLFPEEKDKAILIKNGYNPEKFHVMDSVDKDALFDSLVTNATPDGKLPKEYDKLVLFVGKFADFKGIDVMLDAAKIYEEQGKAKGMDIMTIIVGSGALDEPLRKQAKELNLQNTHFVGRKGPDVICPLQNLSDVSLIPSRNEPFGLVVIEGTACGHPVIGTNAGGIPDIMNITGKIIKKEPYTEKDAEDDSILKPVEGTDSTYKTPLGFLVPMEDAESLANATMRILEGKDTFDNKEIAEYTLNTYSQDVITKGLIDLFQNAIDSYK